MTDLDPAIWDNETLGKAANNERLDRLEKQQHEDRNARLEDREPREVVVDNDYPDWIPEVNPRTGTVPSNAQVVHFADEQQNDVPAGDGPPDETAEGIEDPADPGDGTENQPEIPGWNETTEDQEESETPEEETPEVAYVGEVEDSNESEETQWK